MTKSRRDVIDFPANPFVAFADFLVTILLILILAFVYETFFMNNMFERVAVQNVQNDLLNDLQRQPKTQPGQSADSISSTQQQLSQAFRVNLVQQTWQDGDLQRFWFDDSLSYANTGQSAEPPDHWAALIAFARNLANRQGTVSTEGSRPFKRIIVEGNSHVPSGSAPELAQAAWTSALGAAVKAAGIMESDGGVDPSLIEISGRVNSDENEDKFGRRAVLCIVVTYSGSQAGKYVQAHGR